MNILITGSEGLIGKELVTRLLNSNHKLICVDLKKKNQVKNKNIFFLKKDLLKKKELLNSLKSKKIDLVIHLAAFLGVKKSERFEIECLETNIMGTRNLLDICKKLKIKRIIFSSSSEVYGNLYKRPMKEEDSLSPVSAYGISKVCCETYIKAYAKKKIIHYNIVRFFNIYGNNQKKDFVISKFAKLIAKNREIKIFGSGNQIRSYCHVKDAVEGLIKIIKKGKKNTIYNIGNNLEPVNLKTLVKFFEKLIKKKIKKMFIPFDKSDRSFQREVFFRIPNIEKIKKDTDYLPRIKLAEGLKQIINNEKIHSVF
jgi:UDP-glucose 4-epimerase